MKAASSCRIRAGSRARLRGRVGATRWVARSAGSQRQRPTSRAHRVALASRTGVRDMADESGGERGTVARMEPMRPLPAWVRWARWIYLAFAWIFVGCVLGQVFLAGLATFVDPARWLWHTTFIHFFEFLPILMLPFAFLARLPVLLRW